MSTLKIILHNRLLGKARSHSSRTLFLFSIRSEASTNYLICSYNLFTGSFNDSKSGLTFVPWMPLSASDRHILSVTASRLQSRSPSLVSKSCEFLRDVLFKDFPAEIFLHRPTVLQVMHKSSSFLDIFQSELCTILSERQKLWETFFTPSSLF